MKKILSIVLVVSSVGFACAVDKKPESLLKKVLSNMYQRAVEQNDQHSVRNGGEVFAYGEDGSVEDNSIELAPENNASACLSRSARPERRFPVLSVDGLLKQALGNHQRESAKRRNKDRAVRRCPRHFVDANGVFNLTPPDSDSDSDSE